MATFNYINLKADLTKVSENSKLMVLFSFMAIVRVNICFQGQICYYEIIYESITGYLSSVF